MIFTYHVLLISAKYSQLTLAMITQIGMHETANTRSEHGSPRVEGLIPVRV